MGSSTDSEVDQRAEHIDPLENQSVRSQFHQALSSCWLFALAEMLNYLQL